MKPSNRKIMKKIGAGLMLGLSLFNLGAAWSKAEGWNAMKRTKRLRIKEKDQINSEEAVFAQVAEEEAEKVIKEASVVQKQEQLTVSDLSIVQRIYRIVAIGVLSMGLGGFATSMIFNVPFALGKGMLSLLPGNPHLAVLSLSIDKDEINSNEEFIVSVNLDSAGEVVDDVKLVISYDSELLSINTDDFPKIFAVDESQISDNKKEITIKNKDCFVPRIFSFGETGSLVKLEFQSKNLNYKHDARILINQNKSLVVSESDGMNRNLLGEVKNVNVAISGKINQELKCQNVEDVIGSVGFWKSFVAGSDLIDRSAYWQEINKTGMICAHSNDYFYIAIISPIESEFDDFKFISGQLEQQFLEPDYSWSEGDYNFYVFQILKDQVKEDEKIEINFKDGLVNNKKWPIEGIGKIVFE